MSEKSQGFSWHLLNYGSLPFWVLPKTGKHDNKGFYLGRTLYGRYVWWKARRSRYHWTRGIISE